MKIFYITIILAAFLLIIGVEQCPMPSGGTTTASKSGLDVSLVSGVGFFNPSSPLEQGDTFKVVLNIENYDKTDKRGTICLKDNQDDAYGGIPLSGDCMQFYIPAAEYQNEKLSRAASQKLVFPIDGDYSYHDIPISSNAKLYIIVTYTQTSEMQGNVNVPEPQQETSIPISQTPAPISVKIDKSVSTQQNQYKLNLGFTINKPSDENIKIYTEDMVNENSIKMTLRLSPSPTFSGYPLDCTVLGRQQGIINLANTNFIKCSTLLPLATTSYPLLIRMDYGVKLTKTFDFKIKAKE